MAYSGIHLITPTSVTKAGTGSTATINTNGSVTFSACTSLSLNGVFTGDYTNYIMATRFSPTASGAYLTMRYRASGTDASGGSDYVDQLVFADNTTNYGARTASHAYAAHFVGYFYSTAIQGMIFYFYGPFLTQPTAFRNLAANDRSSATSAAILEYAGTHDLSTAYDGFTLFPQANAFGGSMAVYGMRN